ncbi:HlyD family type I secretion periplasmic adaptor subunit [uncultured Shewanella sp.]|uniref:HlyD family type I secretion periplasmic adaptor subunit n=1 Tax=uncultured Shewanella sp. TaxID=173975 RepID=UPI002633E3AD|nr:HlyD family type I secretion periplasmic adaptor subunit [uncultured Shewanella sp.]
MSDIERYINKALTQEKAISNEEDNNIKIKSVMTSTHKSLLFIFIAVTLVIILASQAKIDIIVSSRGELLLDSDIEKVQHLEGGILEQLMVSQGDTVYEGQPIAKLKSLERHSTLETTNIEIIELELDLLTYQSLINMLSPDFSSYETFPKIVNNYQKKWQSEFNKNTSNESLISHDIEHKEKLIQSMKSRIVSSKSQLDIIKKQLSIKKTLFDEEMASYVDVLAMQIQEMNMLREIENLEEAILNENFQKQRLTKQLTDLISNRNAEYQAKVNESAKQLKIKHAQKPQHTDKVDRLIVYSPVDGIVDKIHFNFKSAVIPPGESIADIAPLKNTLHGEAKIPRKDMGFVEIGQEVKLKFDTYNSAKYGALSGIIASISRSSYEEKDAEFYLANITLEKLYLEKSGIKHKLSPYMEFTAEIKTGSRKVIDYAVKPVMSAIEDTFDER